MAAFAHAGERTAVLIRRHGPQVPEGQMRKGRPSGPALYRMAPRDGATNYALILDNQCISCLAHVKVPSDVP